MKKKLSPELRPYLDRALSTRADPRLDERILLVAEVMGEMGPLEALGFQTTSLIEHPTERYRIVTGSLPVARLAEAAALPQVVAMEGPRPLEPQLNYSLDDIRAVSVHNGIPHRRGRGILVGVIDVGLDWRHGAFVTPGGESRVVALWDQKLRAEAGDEKGPGDIGVVYRNAQITQALKGQARVRSLDATSGISEGHGTHVMGIAAGNGGPASCCHGGGTYVGVAPEADLIAVRYTGYINEIGLGDTLGLLQAINFILAEAEKPPKRPVVINISLGDNLGPHDGTSLVERGIDAAVAPPITGRAIVVGTGNFAMDRCHVEGSVPAHGSIDVEFDTREKFDWWDTLIDLWYARSGQLKFELKVDGGDSSGQLGHGADRRYAINPTDDADDQVEVRVDSTIDGPHNRDHNIRIQIKKPNSGRIPARRWTITLTNEGATPVGFHAWIQRDDNAPVFLPAVDPPDGKVRAQAYGTISVPATAKGAISVGNHQSKTSCCNCFPDDGIDPDSGRGPVARGAAQNAKPDLTAPGVEITAPNADACNLKGNCFDCCPNICCCLYTDKSGTSQAAPHVAGAIALMLEVNPLLSRDEILAHLQASARPRPAGGTTMTWGAGKLNVEGAVQRVVAATGGGGGGGGGVPHMRFEEPRAETRVPFHDSPLHGRGALPPALRAVRARLGALKGGEAIASVVSRHFSEVRRLVNTNRRVAALWHRGRGPRMLHRLIQGAVDPDALAPIGTPVEGAYLARMLDLLGRYGSDRLRASLSQHGPTTLQLLRAPLARQVAALTPSRERP